MALSIGELVGYVDLDTSSAESAASGFGGVLEKMGGQWGKILGGLGAGGALAFGAGLVSAMDTEVGSDMLAASLGGGEKLAARYGDIAGKVYSNGFGAGLEDVNTAMGAVVTSIKGMRGASDKEVQKMTEKAMTFADVMGVDVTRAAQVAGNMVYNGMAKNGAQAFDLLMKASQKVPVQLREDVLDATDEYGQFFTQIGIDGPEAMGLLAKGAEKGMYGIDKAGDAIKEFTIRATDGSKSTLTAFESIGLNGGKMSNDLLAGGDKAKRAFDKTLEGILSIKDPTAKAGAALALFGTPLEDLGTKDIPGFLKSLQTSENGLGKFSGSVDKAGQTAYDNASSNLSVFTRTLKTGFVELIGGSVLPMVNELTGALVTGLGPAWDTVSGAASAVVGWLKQHQTIAAVLVGVITALAVVTQVHAATMAVAAAGGMAQWLAQTKLISSVTKVWTAVQWAMNAALAANPIGLVVVALAAVGAALVVAYKKSEAFRNIVNGALSAVRNAASALAGFFGKWAGQIAGALASAWGSIKSGASAAWNSVKSTATSAWNNIRSAVQGGVSNVQGAIGALSAIPGKVADWFDRARAAVVEKLNAAVAYVKGVPGRITAAVGNLGSLLYNAGASVIDGLIRGITDKVAVLRSKLQSVTNMIPDWKGPAKKDKGLLRRNGQLIMEGLLDGITDGTKDLKALLNRVTDDLGKGKLAKVEKALANEYARGLRIAAKRNTVAKKLETARTALEDAIRLRDDLFASVKSSTLSFGGAVGVELDEDETLTGGAIVKHMQDRLAEVEQFRQNMATLLGQGLDKTTYLDMINKGVDGAGAMATALVQDPAAVRAVADLSGKLTTAADALAKDASTSMYQAGVTTAQSIVDGLELDEAKLAIKAQGVADKIAAALRDALNVAVGSITLDGTKAAQAYVANHGDKGGKGQGKGDGKGRDSRTGPLIGQVLQQPGESADELAERLWYKTRKRG